MKFEKVIYCSDNLKWLKKLPDKCFNLNYLVHPFSQKNNTKY